MQPLEDDDDKNQPDLSGVMGGASAQLGPAPEPTAWDKFKRDLSDAGSAVSKWWKNSLNGGPMPNSYNMVVNGWPKLPPLQADEQPVKLDENPKDEPTDVSAAPSAKGDGMPGSADEILKGFANSGADNDARNKQLAAGRKEKLLGLIPEVAGGIGDAIATGNEAYGVKGNTGVQDEITKGIQSDVDTKKAQFEENLKNDPTSDISKQYQSTAAKAFSMMGVKVAPENLAKMSAAQIEAQMPNIEKVAKMQNDKDMKQLQIQANLLKQKEMLQNRQDNTYVRLSTSLGGDKELNDIKTRKDNIERAYPAVKMAKTPQELTDAALATLQVINPKAMVGSEMLRSYAPNTVGLDAANLTQWIRNNPTDAHVQGFLNRYKMVLDRENQVVEDQYNRAFNRKMASLKPVLEQAPDMASQIYQDWGVYHPQFNPGAKKPAAVGSGSHTPNKPSQSSNDPLGIR